MASFNPEASLPPTPPFHPFSIPLRPQSSTQASSQTEDDEWEYEYSATETETYYLTIDLTTPNMETSRRGDPAKGKSGYRVKWMTSGLGKKKRRALVNRPATSPQQTSMDGKTPPTSTVDSDVEEVSKASVDNSEEDEHEAHSEAPLESQKVDQMSATHSSALLNDIASLQNSETAAALGLGSNSSNEVEHLQILDLHSDNPLISYQQHIFSCTWAENIGTELLFTNRDTTNPLPALRALPDDVDLLAASSARLISTPAILIPRERSRTHTKQNTLDSSAPTRANYVVPVGRNPGRARGNQGRFLERMQALKASRNELDEVTIYVIKRQSHKKWSSEIQKKRDTDRSDAHQMMRRGGRWAEDALVKLEAINREEREIHEELQKERVDKTAKKSGTEAATGARPTKRARTKLVPALGNTSKPRARTKNLGGRPPNRGKTGVPMRAPLPIVPSNPWDEHGMLSTPTPQTWDDLKQATGSNGEDDNGMSG